MADVLLPKWGVSMREGTVTRWHCGVGDRVAAGDPLADVMTDKVDVTLEAPVGGTVQEILVQEDETVPVGSRLAVISDL